MSSSSCVPCEPISHRSFVINLIDDGDYGKLRRILVERPEAGARQVWEGKSPMNFANRDRKVKYLEVLVKAGISAVDVDWAEDGN